MTSLPITTSSVTWPVELTALAALAAAVLKHPRRCRVVGAAVAAGLVLIVAYEVSTVYRTIPLSFVWWCDALLASTAAAAIGWSRRTVLRRCVAVGVVMSVGVAAAVAVNTYYGYYPTVADVLRRPLPDQIQLGDDPRQYRGAGGTDRPVATDRERGRLVAIRIPASRSGFAHRKEWIYLPPAWFDRATPPLPVVVLLPGTPGTTEDWIRAGGAIRTANAWAAAHHGRAPVLVFADPNGSFRADTECVDNHHALVDTYLGIDVPAYITSHFGTASSPDRWAIAGASAGGTCALTVALRHPDVYRTIVDLSGEPAPNHGPATATLRTLFDGSTTTAAGYDPARLLREQTYRTTHAWFAAGTRDHAARRAVDRLTALSARAGIDTRTSLDRRGGHTWAYWRHAFADAFARINTTTDPHGTTT